MSAVDGVTVIHSIPAQLEHAILTLLAARGPGKTICPSEAARAVAATTGDDWRRLMDETRQAAQRLVAAGRLEVTQRGKVVDLTTARGPIRLCLRASQATTRDPDPSTP